MNISPLRSLDLTRCAELERQLFAGDNPWSVSAFRAELDSGACYLGAYDDDGRLQGYAGLAMAGAKGEYEAEVHTIGVAPEDQRRGIGESLLSALLARADEFGAPVYLEVRTDNEPALALYAKAGFVRVGLRKRYYQPSGADAYTLRRPARQGVASR